MWHVGAPFKIGVFYSDRLKVFLPASFVATILQHKPFPSAHIEVSEMIFFKCLLTSATLFQL
jgi:hypothetical protein